MQWLHSERIMANNYEWRVIIEVKQGLNPVAIDLYRTQSYEDACQYLETRKHLINKKRSVFIKKIAINEQTDEQPTMDSVLDRDIELGIG